MEFLNKNLSLDNYPFIVAEISCNHEGNLNSAFTLINEAKKAGANAVKIQAYTPDEMTILVNQEEFYAKGSWAGQHLYHLYEQARTPLEWIPILFDYAKSIDIPIFASVFGEQSLEALEKVNCPAYKIASFEVNDTNLLRKVAQTKKPILLSTGCCTKEELERAENLIKYDVIIMHCKSQYPCYFDQSDIFKISDYYREYGPIIGYSDHTNDSRSAIMAISLGARIFEKHLGLNNNKSPDRTFSTTPNAFNHYVCDIEEAYKAMQPSHNEIKNQYKRSLYAVEDIKKGELITHKNVKSIRPSYGLDPDLLSKIIGTNALVEIPRGTALKKEMIQWKKIL